MSAYNKDLDKITERELVYDIVERLKLGKDFTMDEADPSTNSVLNKVKFKAGTYLLELFKFILNCLPPALLLEIGKVDRYVMYVKAGEPAILTNLESNYSSIYRAYSDKLGMDISDCMYIYSGNQVRIVGTNVKETGELNTGTIATFKNDDIITLYLKK